MIDRLDRLDRERLSIDHALVKTVANLVCAICTAPSFHMDARDNTDETIPRLLC